MWLVVLPRIRLSVHVHAVVTYSIEKLMLTDRRIGKGPLRTRDPWGDAREKSVVADLFM